MKATLLLILATAAFAAPPTYKVITKIKVGGGTRWDYCYRRQRQPSPVRLARHADGSDRYRRR